MPDLDLARAQGELVTALVGASRAPAGIDGGRLDALSVILLNKRRKRVMAGCLPLRRSCLPPSLFDSYARANPRASDADDLDDVLAFLAWLRHRGQLPRELRFVSLRMRLRRLMTRMSGAQRRA